MQSLSLTKMLGTFLVISFTQSNKSKWCQTYLLILLFLAQAHRECGTEMEEDNLHDVSTLINHTHFENHESRGHSGSTILFLFVSCLLGGTCTYIYRFCDSVTCDLVTLTYISLIYGPISLWPLALWHITMTYAPWPIALWSMCPCPYMTYDSLTYCSMAYFSMSLWPISLWPACLYPFWPTGIILWPTVNPNILADKIL